MCERTIGTYKIIVYVNVFKHFKYEIQIIKTNKEYLNRCAHIKFAVKGQKEYRGYDLLRH